MLDAKAAIKALIPRPVIKAGRNLQQEINIASVHRRGVRAAKRLCDQRELKLHFGCGPNKKPGWINIGPICNSMHADRFRFLTGVPLWSIRNTSSNTWSIHRKLVRF
jgi:hypothetical protein